MLNTYCVMALYKCFNSSCENYTTPKSVPTDSKTTTCPDCGATMMRIDLIDKQNQNIGGEK